ncbi:Fidgetin-like protein 1 [Mactra antiquata]
MMDENSSKRSFLSRYQKLVLDEKYENGTPHLKADFLRKLVAHVQYGASSGLIGRDEAESLRRQYDDAYVRLVDSFDEQTGLNNYAEGALEICSGNKNDSQNWKSSLSLDVLKTIPCVRDVIDKSAKENDSYCLSNHKMNDLLPSFHKENHVPQTNASETVPQNKKDIPSKFSFLKQKQTGNQSNERVLGLYHEKSIENQSMFRSNSDTQNFGNMYNQSSRPNSDTRHHGNIQNQSGYQNRSPSEGFNVGNTFENNPGTSRNPLFNSGGRGQPFSRYGDSGINRQSNLREPTSSKRPFNQTEENYEEEKPARSTNVFRTAKQQLDIDNQRKYGGGSSNSGNVNTAAYGTGKKSLGTRRGLNSKFVPPVMNRDDEEIGNHAANTITRAVLKTGGNGRQTSGNIEMEGLDDEKLKGIEPKMIELIMNEIMDNGPPMTWDDVAGLDFAKKTIKEIVVWPMLRPDIFTGLRGPPKGLLLFGPPGTGKTLIGKCIASQSKSTFFCISASSLTSKWVGEGEKMVRALFAVARSRQPAVVFIDEIDSLLTQRTDGENEASRRIKTEFLVQLDGASTSSEDRLLVIGATNRPQEIDEAARRRFVKRLYIPLPEYPARRTIITNLLKQQSYELNEDQLNKICDNTDGFSGADMATLCREAALGPIRDMSFGDIENISADQVRPICFKDFGDALHNVKPSVSEKDLDIYIEWNNTFGSGGR